MTVNGPYVTSTASTPAVVKEIGPPLSGLSLCAEPDQAFLSATVFKLGTHPIKATSDLTAIISVLVAVEGFEQEHPLISAEVNSFSGR